MSHISHAAYTHRMQATPGILASDAWADPLIRHRDVGTSETSVEPPPIYRSPET
jgi:hypothetical protein